MHLWARLQVRQWMLQVKTETCHQFIAIHVSDLVQEIACELPVFVHIVSKSLL